MNFTPRTKPRLPTSNRPASHRQLAYLRSLAIRKGRKALAAAKRHFEIDKPGFDDLTVAEAARLIDRLLHHREGSR